ncbi:phenoloxidase-activating factor 2-like isoform X2 [Bacillus rossius redtenbacheri]
MKRVVVHLAWALLVQLACAQQPHSNDAAHSHASSSGCDCMEYWNCVMSGGNPYSYCGLTESHVCCFVPVGAQPVGLLPVRPGKARCGHKGRDSGRTGVAEPTEWPWHAAILEKQDDLYVCGASLVDESWVLTAAHCVDSYVVSKAESPLKVRLGEYNVTTNHESLRHEEYGVSAVVAHPRYDNATLIHDVALLRLRHPAKKRPNIDVVCLASHTDWSLNTSCVVTGWGRSTEGAPHSVVLKEVPLPLWNNSNCQVALRKQFGDTYILPESTICAGTEGRDACDGDGGGPLVCERRGQWYQVGIVSYGIGCGRPGTPGVYTRVATYHQWILDTVLRYRRAR